jgi:tRNA (guanosine-2'-O-)-methyltransferase
MLERRQKLIEAYYKNKLSGVEILIDNVCDPHNVAAVSRTADGLGIPLIHLYYTYNECPTLGRQGHSSSASATLWMKYNKIEDLQEFSRAKKQEGFRFLAAQKTKGASALHEIEFPEKTVILLGSEKKGLSPELQEICDQSIVIPMVGMVESYNISVAAALIMYQVFLQKHEEVEVFGLEELRGKRE